MPPPGQEPDIDRRTVPEASTIPMTRGSQMMRSDMLFAQVTPSAFARPKR